MNEPSAARVRAPERKLASGDAATDVPVRSDVGVWIVELKKWREHTRHVRAVLLRERESLHKRLHEIDSALAELPSDEPRSQILAYVNGSASTESGTDDAPKVQKLVANPMPPGPTFFIPAKSTLDLIVKCAEESGADGVTAIEIGRWLATRARRTVDPKNLHSYIYKLQRLGRIVAANDKAPRRYVVPAPPPATEKEPAPTET